MRSGCAFAALVAAAALGACALKPPPDPVELRRQALPNLRVPESWVSQGAGAGSVQAGWLGSFNDRQLSALVEEALAYNADVRVAGARVEQAAGYARLAGAGLYPAVNLLARGGGKMSGDNSGLQGVALAASWELDVWGRVRYGRAGADAQYASALADMEYARQSLVALVVKSWFLATEARLQRDVAQEAVRSAQWLVRLAQDRERVGRGDAIDVANAQANLETYRDTLRQIELSYQQAVRALELLLGRYPAALLAVPEELAPVAGPIPAGLPSELLERRPDVIAAQRRVAAAFNRVGEAQTARLPRISLTASINSISSELFVLQDRDNPSWSAGASLLQPIYQGGALKEQVEIRTAEQKQAVAEYARVAQRAFGEVENTLSAEIAAREREQILVRGAGQSERALKLARIGYDIGSLDLRSVQQQMLSLYALRSALVRMQSEQRVQRVNLHLALGGGFEGPDTNLHDRSMVSMLGEVMLLDVYRVVGTGGAQIQAPPNGWPAQLKVRLHEFRPLSSVNADAIAASGATQSVMMCTPARGWISRDGYKCEVAGRRGQKALLQDDYVEIDVPAGMTSTSTARIEVRWAEVGTVASR